jgi:hypothetical protein
MKVIGTPAGAAANFLVLFNTMPSMSPPVKLPKAGR